MNDKSLYLFFQILPEEHQDWCKLSFFDQYIFFGNSPSADSKRIVVNYKRENVH